MSICVDFHSTKMLLRNIAAALALAALVGCGKTEKTVPEALDEDTQQDQVENMVEEIEHEAMKAVGSTMQAYPVITRYGKPAKLTALFTAPYNLVAFYTPSGEGYRQTFDDMFMNSTIGSSVSDKKLNVIVVDTESTLEDLRLKASYFPPIWVITTLNGEDVAIDTENTPTPFNPTLYLVDKRGNVLAVSARASELLDIVSNAQ